MLIKSDELVVDLFASTFVIAKACSKIPWRRHLVACGVHTKCFAASAVALVKTYARKVLNKKTNISVSDEAVDVCTVLVRAKDGLQGRKPVRSS